MPAGSPTMQQRRDPTERERVRHGEHVIEHLLRRAGFGAGQDEIDDYLELGLSTAIQQLLYVLGYCEDSLSDEPEQREVFEQFRRYVSMNLRALLAD